MNQKLSTDILRTLRNARSIMTLDDLCEALGVSDAVARDGVRRRTPRREDVRATVGQLDRLGFVDAIRMRLTLQGFALAAALGPAPRAALHLVA